jgi:cytidine deaminase
MAEKARESAYAPYSGFKVGAALLTSDGKIFTGCNIENSSYGATMCAERVAIFKAVSEGYRGFSKLAVTAMPCGMCRQALLEVEHKQGTHIRVLLYGEEGTHCIESIEALMPLTFNAESMEI